MNIKAVKGPKQINPFEGNPEQEAIFWETVSTKQENRVIPEGYGLIPGEHNYENYDSVEMLPVGGKGSGKAIQIILPKAKWLPRIVLWLQALETMYEMAYN